MVCLLLNIKYLLLFVLKNQLNKEVTLHTFDKYDFGHLPTRLLLL